LPHFRLKFSPPGSRVSKKATISVLNKNEEQRKKS
jgi:hypothetical protein